MTGEIPSRPAESEIPFYAAQREWAAHCEELLAAIEPVLASGRWLQGPAVAALEAALAERIGRAHAVAVGSGTDALFFALVAAGVGPGDEVIVPDFSFIATGSAVLRCRAVPRWADVDSDGILDLQSAGALVGPRTVAVIAVPLYGRPLDAERVESFAAEHGLALIEDAAQAFGAARGERSSGAVGMVSCLSFDPTKPLAAPGSGGALLTDDDRLAEHARRLRWHGRDVADAHAELGYNSQLPEASAAALLVKLRHEPAWCDRRRAIAGVYAPLRGPAERDGERHAFSKYVLRVKASERDAIRTDLAAAGIPTQVHYPAPLHTHPLFGAGAVDTPMASTLAGEVLSLPMHAFLAADDSSRVVEALRPRIA